jgi:hypothetical protein
MFRHYIAIFKGTLTVPSERCSIEEQSIEFRDGRVVTSDVMRGAHITRRNMPIQNTLSTATQLSISQKELRRLPEGM